ncbi:two-component system, OmpR family, sensor histidine kinase PhoQ [Thiohalomonas denitrificans]|uniref:histidine kinase n=2 Tax=Thiohalomonas denitrificans TaxID=415747 RepID=A0A1G5QV77_9GAMM|nr:two-component system, OmpR family, sensor histidine kinase PhoQ [Thiohalomonas denitrificans]
MVLAIFIAATAVALERAFEDSARSAMHERLFAQLYLIMAATEVNSEGELQMPAQLGEPRLNLPGSGLYARIERTKGEVLWQSVSALGLELPTRSTTALESDRFTHWPPGEEEYFLATLDIEWESEAGSIPLTFRVMEAPDAFHQQMTRYRHSLWGWLGAMAFLLLLALAGALVWGLRPLRTVAGEVRAIESGKQQSLQRDYPKEIRRLTDNINALLHHERAQQLRHKNALADLAHSLKTPLAVLRGLGGSERSPVIDEQIATMDNIVQYQLQRASTAGRSALATPVDVAPLAERLLATLQKVYRDKTVEVEKQLDGDCRFRGDEGDLMELLGNLLDNAWKWAGRKIWLRVEGGDHDSRFTITVEDDGPGIEAERAEQVLARGVRLDEATPGHGIGLPMVRDIVTAYEGTVAIEHSSHGGARIVVRLPQ